MTKLIFGVLLTVLACDEVTPPTGSGVVQITIEPRAPTLVPGESIGLEAIARYASGASAEVDIQWATSDADVASVSRAGILAARSAGNTFVIASFENVRDSVHVTVCKSLNHLTNSRFKLLVGAGTFYSGNITPTGINGAAAYDNEIVMFGGGLLFGTSAEDLVIGYPLVGLPGRQIQSDGVCSFELQEGEYTKSFIRVHKSGKVPPLRVVQETFTTTLRPASNAVLLRYTFVNNGSERITGLRVGMAVDWDLHLQGTNPSDERFNDHARYNAALDAAEVFGSSFATAGMASAGMPVASYSGIIMGPGAPETAAGYWDLLSGGKSPNVIGPADVSTLTGFSPLTIEAGDSTSLMMLFTAGRRQQVFSDNVVAAQQIASSFPRRQVSR